MKKIVAFGLSILAILALVINMIPKVHANFMEDAFVMPDLDLTSVLSSNTLQYYDPIDLYPVKKEEEYTEKFGKIYIEDNRAINLDYPVIINDATGLRFLNSNSYIIDTDFIYSKIVKNSIIASNTYFNEEGRAVDKGNYMMAQLPNRLFISADVFTFETALKTYTINKNSIFYFDENFVNVYEYTDGAYEFKALHAVTSGNVIVQDLKLSYADFYANLLHIKDLIIQDQKEEEIIEETIEEIIEEEKDTVTNLPKPVQPDKPDKPETPLQTPENPPAQPEKPEIGYVKPEVEISNLSAWVYTLNGDIKIKDPAGRIRGGVVFYIYDKQSELVARQSVSGSQSFDISTLEPDNTFVVRAEFQYLNKAGNIATEEVIEESVFKTLPMEGNLSSFRFEFDKSQYALPKSLRGENAILKNNSDWNPNDESLENFYKNTLPYIARLTFMFADGNTVISTNVANKALDCMKKGNVCEFETNDALKSKTHYEYVVEAYDKFGNRLPLSPAVSGEYLTSRGAPSIKGTVASSDMNSVTLKLQLNDIDQSLQDTLVDMKIQDSNGNHINFDYVIDGNQYSSDNATIDFSQGNVTIILKNLPVMSRFVAYFSGDYDLQNGQGLLTDQLLGKVTFISGGIPTGVINFDNQFHTVGDTYATMDLSISRDSNTELVQLIDQINGTIEGSREKIKYSLTEDLFNNVDVDTNYDINKNALIIQKGNANDKIVEIALVANKDTIKTNGAWKTFINSAIFGETDINGGYVQITYVTNTLKPNTEYIFDMNANVQISGKYTKLNSTFEQDHFKTTTVEPIVTFDDFFLATNFIEIYDIQCVDDGNTIVNDNYSIQLLANDQLLEVINLKVGEQTDVIRFDHLNKGVEYKINFVANEFTGGLNGETIFNHSMLNLDFTTDEGVSSYFEIESIRSGYEAIHNDKFFDETQIKKGYSYDVNTKQEIEDPSSFITDYIKVNDSSYKAIQNFAAPGEAVRIIYFDDNYKYVGTHNTSSNGGFVSDEYVLNYYNRENVKYYRIVGKTGYEKNARFYELNASNLQEIVNVKQTAANDPNNPFVDGIYPGQNGFDSSNPSYSTTDFIEVNPGETLYFKSNRTRYIYFYTEDEKFISSTGGHYAGATNLIDVPSNAKYVRYSIEKLDKENDAAVLYRIKDFVAIDYEASLKWTIQDDANDKFTMSVGLDSTDFMIKKYVSDSVDDLNFVEEYSNSLPLSFTNDNGVDTFGDADERLAAKKAFKYEVLVNYHGREIVIATFEFNTKNRVYLINNAQDMRQIMYDSFATYLVTTDLEEDSSLYAVNANFGGTLDFQNHSFKLADVNNSFISNLTPSGEIKNVHVIMDKSYNRFFVNTNYGHISNIKYTVSLAQNDYVLIPLIGTNQKDGIIENFAIEMNGNTTIYNKNAGNRISLFNMVNYGIIRNGYAYNTDKKAYVNFVPYPNQNSYGGIINGFNPESGQINNVYAEANISVNYDKAHESGKAYTTVGMISGYNTGRVSNAFGVGTRTRFDFNYELETINNRGASHFDHPMFGHLSTKVTATDLCTLDYTKPELLQSINYSNKYQNILFYDTASNTYDCKFLGPKDFDTANLYDESWYLGNINKDNQFDVSYVHQGYYPLIKNTEGGVVVGQKVNPLPKNLTHKAPEFLDYTVNEVTNDYVDVVFKFNNETESTITDIIVKDVKSQILSQEMINDVYHVTVRLSDPSVFVTGYIFESYTYNNLIETVTVPITPKLNLDVSFYKTISSKEEWNQWLVNQSTRKMNYNYRLIATLDFSGISGTDFNKKYRVDTVFNGKLDGNGYAIQNINLNDSSPYYGHVLMRKVQYGQITNLEFRNITYNKSRTHLHGTLNNNYVGIFQEIDNSTVDSINLVNINLTGQSRIGALSTYAANSDFSNITANDIKLASISYDGELYYGGLIGYASICNIHNSYIRNLDIQTDTMDLSQNIGVGGLVGYATGSSRIFDVYVTGKIQTTSYTGGIAGYGNANITRAYSDVYIESTGDYNAGIFGTVDVNAAVSNSFSVGNFIHAISNPLYTNRIISSENYWYLNNNYGYVNQTFNNQQKDEADASALLSYDQFLDQKTYTDTILLGNAFDYSNVETGALPPLKDTHGNLLPYQENPHYLTTTSLRVDNIQANITNDGKYALAFDLYHENYLVDNVRIDGMHINVTDISSQVIEEGKITHYQIVSSKEAALDFYNLRVSLINAMVSSDTKELVVSISYQEPAYWEIRNINQWQEVMSSKGYSNENFLITGTIDFSGVKNPYVNISANRIVATEEGKIINYTHQATKNNTNLISTVYGSIDGLKFENVHIEVPLEDSYSNVAIVGIVQGNASNLEFDNCSISAGKDDSGNFKQYINKTHVSKTGMIGSVSGDIDTILANNIAVMVNYTNRSTNNMIGGLIAYMSQNAQNIHGTDIFVNAYNGFNVGGLIGYAQRKSTEALTIKNASLTSSQKDNKDQFSHIKGIHKIGGLIGFVENIALFDLSADHIVVDCYITDYESDGYVGGIVGDTTGTLLRSEDNDKPTISNSFIQAGSSKKDQNEHQVLGRAGAVAGYLRNTATNLYVTNTTVDAYAGAGGIAGLNGSTIRQTHVYDCDITAHVSAGGLSGFYGTNENSFVENTRITAVDKYAGGIVGAVFNMDNNNEKTTRAYSRIYGSTVKNSTISANTHAGGISGYGYTTNAYVDLSSVKYSIIHADNGYAGGIVGESDGYGIYRTTVDPNTKISNSGSYTGGIVGKLKWSNDNNSGHFMQNIFIGKIDANDFTGGIVGYYENIATQSNRFLNHYSNINMGSIVATGNNVYAYGYIQEGSFAGGNHNKHLSAFENATMAGKIVTEEQLSNIKDTTALQLTTYEQLSDRWIMVNSISETNFGFTAGNWYDSIYSSSIMESFVISYKGMITHSDGHPRHRFRVEGVNLEPGNYKLDIKNKLDGDVKQTFDIYVDNKGVVKSYENGQYNHPYIDTKGYYNPHYMTIYRQDADSNTKEIFASASIGGINPSKTYHSVTVSNASENYLKADTVDSNGNLKENKPITITINDDQGLNYKWYKIFKGNAYGGYTVQLQSSDKNIVINNNTHSLTTDASGVYYAVSEDNQHYTELFRYDGVTYYPILSRSTSDILEHEELIPLANVYRIPNDKIQEPEEIVLPTYDVYTSGINSFNIEFDSNISMNESSPNYEIGFEFENGSEVRFMDIDSRVMSFAYDFNDEDGFKIIIRSKLDNTVSESNVIINDTLAKSISLTQENYYYIDENKNVVKGQIVVSSEQVDPQPSEDMNLSTQDLEENSEIIQRGNTNIVKGPFIHIYNNLGLIYIDNQIQIIDLETSQIKELVPNGTKLERIAIDQDKLSTGMMTGDMEYYLNFMLNTDNNEMIDTLTYQLTNGEVGINFNGVKHIGPGIILDKSIINDQMVEIIMYLTPSHKLFTTNAVLPDGFKANGVMELVYNVNSLKDSAPIAFIKYVNSVYMFNYKTGDVILNVKTGDAKGGTFRSIGQFASEYFNNFMAFMMGEEPVTDIVSYEHVINDLNQITDSEMHEIYSITLDGNDMIVHNDTDVMEGEGFNEQGIVNNQQGIESNDNHEESIVDETIEENVDISTNDLQENQSVANISREYVPVFNAADNTYDIYTKEAILQNDLQMSENEKVEKAINQGYILSNPNVHFNKNAQKASSDFVASRVLIYAGISISVVGLLILLSKKIKSIKH